MCGFAGELQFDGRPVELSSVEKMSGHLQHRGPDGCGVWQRGPLALAHRRLTIIDLSCTGEQPMVDSELGLSIVFNGCLYNYRELRSELKTVGYRFFSTSDTEVILKAYHRWGTGCVERFLGMFAFVVAERDSGRIVMARDRLGIKPLYVARTPKRLRFASTLPALVAAGGVDTSIDRIALHHYMTFHSMVPAPLTILNGVRKFPRRRCASSSRMAMKPTTCTGGPRSPEPTPRCRRASGRSACSTSCASLSSAAWSPTSPSGGFSPAGSTRASSSRYSPSRDNAG